uniref:Uncharacterized protein n=1 Tax=Panagrolaimus davidi TaxID=227884 RepID=A0A914PP42_9BILA
MWDKIAAIGKALNDEGVIIHNSFFYTNEIEAFDREGAIIELLRQQLTNHKGGEFPALELDKKGKMYVRGKQDTKDRSKPRKYIVTNNQLTDFAINTLVRSYETFLCRTPYVIKEGNMASLIGKTVNGSFKHIELFKGTSFFVFMIKNDHISVLVKCA